MALVLSHVRMPSYDVVVLWAALIAGLVLPWAFRRPEARMVAAGSGLVVGFTWGGVVVGAAFAWFGLLLGVAATAALGRWCAAPGTRAKVVSWSALGQLLLLAISVGLFVSIPEPPANAERLRELGAVGTLHGGGGSLNLGAASFRRESDDHITIRPADSVEPTSGGWCPRVGRSGAPLEVRRTSGGSWILTDVGAFAGGGAVLACRFDPGVATPWELVIPPEPSRAAMVPELALAGWLAAGVHLIVTAAVWLTLRRRSAGEADDSPLADPRVAVGAVGGLGALAVAALPAALDAAITAFAR